MAKKDEQSSDNNPSNQDSRQDNSNNSGDSNAPSYLTEEKAQELFQKQMAGFGTLTQDEKQGLMQFVDNMGIILDVIENDSALKGTIQERARQKMGVDNGQNNKSVPSNQQNENQGQNNNSQIPNREIEGVKSDVGSVVRSRRAEIIEGFERQYGIDKLPDEDKDSVRKKLGQKLLQWGHKIEAVPVDHLKGLIEDAYLTVAPEKLKDQGYVQGILAARAGELGNIPAMGGGSVPNSKEQSGELSKGQMDYVQKLGVDPQKAKETVKATT